MAIEQFVFFSAANASNKYLFVYCIGRKNPDSLWQPGRLEVIYCHYHPNEHTMQMPIQPINAVIF